MTIKIIPTYTIDSCDGCPFASGLETHSEDEYGCFHKSFPIGRQFDTKTNDVQKWCPLQDAK